MAKLELISIEQAAREYGLRRDRAKELAIEAGIALNLGKSKKHPRLRVPVAAFERVLMEQTWKPSAKASDEPKPRRISADLNPRVRC